MARRPWPPPPPTCSRRPPPSWTAACRSAAATARRWPASTAPPRTSSPRTTCAPRAHVHRGAGSHHDGPGEVVFASKAFPCTAALRVFAEEGLGCDVASGGELHLALRAGFAPERLYLHGNAKSEAELRMALEAGVGTIVLDNAHEAQRLSALLGGARTQRVLIRVVPGVDADTHEAILTGQAGSKFGFAPGEARALAASPPPGVEVAGLHMHLGSQLFALEPYRRAVRAIAGARRLHGLRPRRRARRPLHGGGPGTATPRRGWPAWSRPRTPSSGRTRRWCSSPAARWSPAPASRSTRVESVKPGAAGELLVAVDGGMSDNLRPMLYGASYEAHLAARMGADGVTCTVVGKHCESGDVLVRDAELPGAAPGRRARDARSPAPTATRWPTTTTASRARRSCSAAAAARGSSCAARPTRTCMAATSAEPFRIGLLGHGTVGSAFEALLAERADAVAAITGLRPEVTGVLTRSRGDFAGDPRRRSDLIVELIGGIEPAREYVLAAMRAGTPRRLGQQAAALPARRGAVGERARARRAAALRGRGGGRRAGDPRAAGVARRRARRAHARDRQRHDELHPVRDGAQRRSPTSRRSRRRRSSATPRPTRPTT